MSITEERVLMGMYLREWSQQDDDVRTMIAGWCSKFQVPGYAELAEQHPEEFDTLYEFVKDLLEESPSIGHLPGFMQ